MAMPRHKAIAAGLALTLTFGSAAAPAVATLADNSPTTDTDPNGMGNPAPADYNKSDFYQGEEEIATFARARSAANLEPVSLSDEMKYFAKFESNRNYDQVLSYGDGYNAMGYYQFDRRYSLIPFIEQVYAYNPTKYSMFESILGRKSLITDNSYSMYDSDSKQLTGLAQDLNAAWHAAYAADAEEFSALQDSYAYNNYYLPVQSLLLNKYGIDVRNRADCVKGLVWGMCNLFGQGGVQKFFKDANLSNDMSDAELVSALCDTVVDRVTYYYPSQPQYHAGWQNRYRKEKTICLEYIAVHEEEANKPTEPETPSTPDTPSIPDTPANPGEDETPGTNDQPATPNVPEDTTPGDKADDIVTPDKGGNADDAVDGDKDQVDGPTAGNDVDADVDKDADDAKDEAKDEANVDSKDAAEKESVKPIQGETARAKDSKKQDNKKAEAAGDLPQTGDMVGVVMAGAAGLSLAGASFVTLGKLEKRNEDEDER